MESAGTATRRVLQNSTAEVEVNKDANDNVILSIKDTGIAAGEYVINIFPKEGLFPLLGYFSVNATFGAEKTNSQ